MVVIEQFVVNRSLFTMVVDSSGRTGRGRTLGCHGFGRYAGVSDDLFLTLLAFRPVVNTVF